MINDTNAYCGVMDDSISRIYDDMKFFYEYVEQQREIEQFVNESIVLASGNTKIINSLRAVNESAGDKIKNFFNKIRNFFKKIFSRFSETLSKTFSERKKYIDNPKYNNIIFKYKYQSGDVDMVDHFTGIERVMTQLDNDTSWDSLIPADINSNSSIYSESYSYFNVMNEGEEVPKQGSVAAAGQAAKDDLAAAEKTLKSDSDAEPTEPKDQQNSNNQEKDQSIFNDGKFGDLSGLKSIADINATAEAIGESTPPDKASYIKKALSNQKFISSMKDFQTLNNDNGEISVEKTFTSFFMATTDNNADGISSKSFSESQISNDLLSYMISFVYHGDKLVEKANNLQKKIDGKLANCYNGYQKALDMIEKNLLASVDSVKEVNKEGYIYLEPENYITNVFNELSLFKPAGTATDRAKQKFTDKTNSLNNLSRNYGTDTGSVNLSDTSATKAEKEGAKKSAAKISKYYTTDRANQFSAMSDIINTMAIKMTQSLQAAGNDYWAIITHHVEWYLSNPAALNDSNNKVTTRSTSGEFTKYTPTSNNNSNQQPADNSQNQGQGGGENNEAGNNEQGQGGEG